MKPKNLKEHQISKEIHITNETEILKEPQISKEAHVTNEPQILKDDQLLMKPKFQTKSKF